MTGANFNQLFDVPRVRKLMELFHRATGAAVRIASPLGDILMTEGWQDICIRSHHTFPATQMRYQKDIRRIAETLQQTGYAEYRCEHGFRNIAIPILADGITAAILLIGQFFRENERLDEAAMREQAIALDRPLDEYRAAIEKIPVLATPQIAALKQQAAELVDLIGHMGETAMRLKRESEKSKRWEADQRTASQLFRSLLDAAKDVVLLLHEDVIVDCNEEACRTFGDTRDKMIGASVLDFSPGFQPGGYRSPDRARHYVDQALGGQHQFFAWRHQRRDGTLIDCEVQLDRVQVEGETLVLAIVRDVTDRLRAQETLRLSERKLRSVFHGVEDAVFLLDLQGKTLDLNDKVMELFRVSRQKALQESFRKTFSAPQNDEKRFDKAWYAAQLGNRQVFEWRALRPSDRSAFDAEIAMHRIAWDDTPAILLTVRDISDRTSTAEELRRSREQYRELYNNAQVGLYRTTVADGRIVECNRRFAATFGYDDPELFRREYRFGENYVNPEVRKDLIARLRKNGAAVDFEAHMYRRDRSIVWVRYSATLSPDGRCLEGFAFDITAQKEAEKKREETERRYQTLFECMQSGFCIVDIVRDEENKPVDYRYLQVNPAFERLTGVSAAEAVKGSARRLFPYISQEWIQAFADVAETGRSAHIEELNIDLDRVFEIHAFRTPDNHVAVLFQDVTERRQAQDAHQRLATAVENSAEAIVIVDLQQRIEYVNPAFERITAYARTEAIGRISSFLKITDPDGQPGKVAWETAAQGNVWTGKLAIERKDGQTSHVEGTVSPIIDSRANIAGLVAVMRDVTAEIRLETQLRQVQKLESLGQLAGGVAHDFNNLIQVIQGNAELARDYAPPESPIAHNLAQIERAGKRAVGLIDQLLAFSRRQTLQPVPFDANRALGELMKMLRRLLDENVALVLETAPDLPQAMADPGQFEQIVINLCVNARDAMPDGGSIAIRTWNQTFDERDAEAHPWIRPGRFVALSVADTGSGMSPEIKERIFEPFFTTKQPGKGTGLGLATVYGIVQQHNGLIDLQTEPGKGTEFRIYLPVAAASGASHETHESESSWTEGAGHLVLLVEDDPHVRTIAHKILESAGYRVIEASDGEEGLRRFEADADKIRLLISDVVMPGMNGPRLHRTIQEKWGPRPMLFVTGHSLRALDEVTPGPGVGLIQKPYRRAELLKQITELIRQTA